MRGSDNIYKPTDQSFRPVGAGMAVTRECWKCKLPKVPGGGAYRTPLKLWHCKECK